MYNTIYFHSKHYNVTYKLSIKNSGNKINIKMFYFKFKSLFKM